MAAFAAALAATQGVNIVEITSGKHLWINSDGTISYIPFEVFGQAIHLRIYDGGNGGASRMYARRGSNGQRDSASAARQLVGWWMRYSIEGRWAIAFRTQAEAVDTVLHDPRSPGYIRPALTLTPVRARPRPQSMLGLLGQMFGGQRG